MKFLLGQLFAKALMVAATTHTVTAVQTVTIDQQQTALPHQSNTTVAVAAISQRYSFIGPSASSLEFNTVLSGYSSASQTAFKHGIIFLQTNPTDPIGYLLSSDNSQTGNIFMGLVKEIQATPSTTYALNFTVDFLTNVAAGCAGIGASPGDNVYVEVGASGSNPAVAYTGSSGLYEFHNLNVNVNLTVAGSFGSDALTDCYDSSKYVSKELSTSTNYPVTSDKNGNIWLMVGTNSFFEGTTAVYWQNLKAHLTPVRSGNSTKV